MNITKELRPSPRGELEITDVNSLVTDLTSFMDQEFSAQDIGVRIELAETLPDVRMDRDQMRQAILNLLRNAMEATEDNGTVVIDGGEHTGALPGHALKHRKR